ncbi:MAG: phenylpyruvate tautomerase MIF-related protein [Eubacterium sp.]
MPFINTNTNVKISKEQEAELKARLGKAIELLGKSESWLMLSFEDECNMYFKGDSSSPMAFVDISVFGRSTDEGCEKMTKEVCSIYHDVLGIQPDKLYVKYSGTNQWGWNNMNF